MKRLAAVLLALLAALTALAQGVPGELLLSRSPKTKDLRLAFAPPEGYAVTWLDDERGDALVQLSCHSGRADYDNFVVLATPFSTKERGKDADAYFTPAEIEIYKTGLKAHSAQRVKNTFWNGAVFEGRYTRGGLKAEARFWVTVADNYVVLFQCNVVDDGKLGRAEQSAKDRAAFNTFRELVMSVRRVE